MGKSKDSTKETLKTVLEVAGTVVTVGTAVLKALDKKKWLMQYLNFNDTSSILNIGGGRPKT